jgi:C4-dicarboxylate-specific signal transduction histidine kinase
VVIAGILMGKKICYWTAAFAGICFIVLSLGEMSGLLEHYTLSVFPHDLVETAHHGHAAEASRLGHASHEPSYVYSRISVHLFVLFFSAYLTGSLAGQLNRTREVALSEARKAISENTKLNGVVAATRFGLAILEKFRLVEWIGPTTITWSKKFRSFLESSISELGKMLDEEQKGNLPQRRNIEVTYTHSNHATKSYRISMFPIDDQNAGQQKTAALIQDITEQKLVQAQLIQASKMAAIGELSGNIVHEINNPVGIISAKGRLLLSDFMEKIPEKVGMEIKKIVELADRITKITRGMLRFSRPSNGPKAPVNINDAIIHTRELIEHNLKKAQIKVSLELSLSPVMVWGNINELEQVFLNVFNNAVDAMSEGDELRVFSTQSTDRRNPEVEIHIQDSGTGIAPEVANRIYDPFFTTKKEGKGTGLGLSICKRIVEDHNGSISVESAVLKGTLIRIRLPVHINLEENTKNDQT